MPPRFKGQRAGAGGTASAGQPVVRPPPGWDAVLTGFLLALAVWVVFGQTVHYEFVNFDDQVYVTANPQVLSGLSWQGVGWAFTNLDAGFWQPLTWLSLMTDAQIYGPGAGGYHLSNVLLHGVNTLLLFLLLRRLTGALGRSAVVAALFAVHPLHVEAVAWVSERKEVLSATFGMLTLLFYARYATRGPRSQARGQRSVVRSPWSLSPLSSPLFYLLSLFCFACGLMSKTMVVTLPVVMLLLDYWPLRRWELAGGNVPFPVLRRLVWEKLPFFGLAFAAGLLTIHAQKGVGALMDAAAFPLKLRAANAALAGAGYLWQTVWPAGLAVFYPYPTSFSPGWVLVALLLLSLISLAALWLGRRHPYLAVGWFWYVITLAPVSGLIQIGRFARADRFTYVPLVGIFLMASWGLAALGGGWRRRRAVLGTASAMIVTGLLVLAWVQTRYWRDSVSLWTRALACTSGNYLAHNKLGIALAEQGKLDAAIPHFERALQLDPNALEVHNNLGITLARQGKLEAAIPHFERALQLNPDFAQAGCTLAWLLATCSEARLRNPAEALRRAQRARELTQSRVPEVLDTLAAAQAAGGDFVQAVETARQALELATAASNPMLAGEIQSRLRLYQAGQPYYQSPPAPDDGRK